MRLAVSQVKLLKVLDRHPDLLDEIKVAYAYNPSIGGRMATTTHIPVELYLHSSEWEPDAEYVDGQIEERPMGEWNHADWQAAILEFFRARRRDWNIRAAAELRVQVSAGNFRIPDVTVLGRNIPVEQVITHPPIAVFEILSPKDTVTRMMTKLGDYEQMGI